MKVKEIHISRKRVIYSKENKAPKLSVLVIKKIIYLMGSGITDEEVRLQQLLE